ncbi:unnamed protein product [Porites evermanni]|uniref:Uncharacterized protein n=1 Tax=Porites evermanni TaxID=104178 RepID=A0ABN8QCN9_9CNID|nr:unnamed protein product [Porites evermanni]
MASAHNEGDPLGVTNSMKKEGASNTTAIKSQGKLKSLPKEELIKFVKKQLALLKQTKAKCEDLSSQLEEERNEVQRLEAEKKEWLSRGVHAEFEKKDKELEEDFSAVVMERNGLQESLRILQEEYQTAVKEKKKYKDALELQALQEDKAQDQLKIDNEHLLGKIQELQHEKERTQETLLKLEQEKSQLLDNCKELELKINSLESMQSEATKKQNDININELHEKLAKLMVEKEECRFNK